MQWIVNLRYECNLRGIKHLPGAGDMFRHDHLPEWDYMQRRCHL